MPHFMDPKGILQYQKSKKKQTNKTHQNILMDVI